MAKKRAVPHKKTSRHTTDHTKNVKSKAKRAESIFTKDARMKTADGFQNFVARLGLQEDNALSAGHYEFNLVTKNRIQLEAAYRGSWICGRAVDSVAEDMTRAGITMELTDENTSGESDIKTAKSMMSKLGIWTSLASLIKWGRLYGGAIGVIDIEGQDFETPLDPETVSKGQFKGIIVYDRWQLNPNLFEVIRNGPDTGLPKFYDIVTNNNINDPADQDIPGGVRIHHSRVIRMIGIELPFFQAITEMMWGESILERVWDRLIPFDTTTMSAANLVNKASLRTVKVDRLREIVAAGGPALEGLMAQFDAMRRFQLNEGITLLDKEDEFQNDSYTFAGLDSILLSQAEQVSGAVEVPLMVLFSQTPAGLNATGDAELRMYYDNINSKQEAKLRNPMELIMTVLWRSTFGRAKPLDLGFTFTPLWQMTQKDKADIAKSNAETIIGAFEAGLNTKSASMKELRDQSGNTGLFSNITDEVIKEAEDEDPPMPAGNDQTSKEVPDMHLTSKSTEKYNTGDSYETSLQRLFKRMRSKKK